MHKHIKTLVETFFEDTYYHELSFIFEDQHVVLTYKNVLKEIEKIYEQQKYSNQDQIIYTGYNLNIDTQKVSLKNNQNIEIPIYAKLIFTDDRTVYAALEERDDHPNKIIVQLNVNYIMEHEELLYSSIHHEFLHVREMYCEEDLNVLQLHKNIIPDRDNEINLFKHLNKNDFKLIMNICYLFNKSEERARINGVYSYVLHNKNKYDKNSYDSYIKQFIKLSDDVSCIHAMKKCIDDIELRETNLLFVEALSYYMHKYYISSIRFKEYHFDTPIVDLIKLYRKNSDWNLTAVKVIESLGDNLTEFLKGVKNVIYKAYNDDKE